MYWIKTFHIDNLRAVNSSHFQTITRLRVVVFWDFFFLFYFFTVKGMAEFADKILNTYLHYYMNYNRAALNIPCGQLPMLSLTVTGDAGDTQLYSFVHLQLSNVRHARKSIISIYCKSFIWQNSKPTLARCCLP